ncbi:MAG: succinylglutamate desuccinylase/aspartoacylase family protein [Gammaproteobacteria bacterium]|nr:MAG: succinylglutamate desuccinylase/aspartoacylase family protein [Gammaproteobacteria bacterium]
MSRGTFEIGGCRIQPGARASIDLRIPDLYTHNPMHWPVHVVHGRRSGPILFLSGAIHGDEINGVEIIRRVLKLKSIERLHGTLIAVPVVNLFGFINQSRYLPDRRDLNRSFPGSETGSLAGRMANLFMREVVTRCTHGIDIHTAAIHRDNLPQVRAVLDDPETSRMAHAFYTPVIVKTSMVPGSLRASAARLGIPVIVYEAGEALRFDELSIRAGVTGIVSVMRELGMLPPAKRDQDAVEPLVALSSTWVRAPQSGILRSIQTIGARVEKNALLGIISDPFGESEQPITAPDQGIIIGRTNIPLVSEGEALFHLAQFRDASGIAEQIEEFRNEFDPATDTRRAVEPPIL